MCDFEGTRELRDLVHRLACGEYEFDAEAAALETRIKDLTGHPWVGEVIFYPPDPHPLENELVRRFLACRPIALSCRLVLK